MDPDKKHAKYDGVWLQSLFDNNKNIKKGDLGDYLSNVFGWQKSSGGGIITRMLSSSRSIKASEAAAIMDFFNTPNRLNCFDDSHSGNFSHESLDKIIKNAPTNLNSFDFPENLLPFSTSGKNLVILKIAGDSMSPDLNDGDHVMIDLNDQRPSPSGIFALEDGTGGTIFKRLEMLPHHTSQKIRVTSSNPQYSPYEVSAGEINISGRVVLRIGKV